MAIPQRAPHRFVDGALLAQAYEDTALPIGLGQTISKPSVVARMVELLMQGGLRGPDGKLGRVLDIGTGCGYQAVVLAQVASEVYSIERLRDLHEKARANLRPLRIANVHLILGDGMAGFAKGAPYAGIIAAAGGEAVPDAWIEQLAYGGRLVAPIATAAGQQALFDTLMQGRHVVLPGRLRLTTPEHPEPVTDLVLLPMRHAGEAGLQCMGFGLNPRLPRPA